MPSPTWQTDLSVAQTLLKAKEIADFCTANAAATEAKGTFPVPEFELIAQSGLLAVPLLPKWGGLGLGIDANLTYELLMLLKQIGRGNLAVGRIYEGHVNALQLIQTFGSEEQIAAYAEDARDRHYIFGVWNAEAGDGVKVIPLENGGAKLEGSKTFCSGASYVQRPFVNGALPDGKWQMCIVPMEQVATVSDPSWWQPPGMRATVSYKIDFTGVELDAHYLIGQPDEYNRQPWLSGGAIRFAAVQLGGAEALFNMTRDFLRSLQRTSDPYQEMRLGQIAIALESGHQWLRSVADLMANYHPIFGGSPQADSPDADRIVTYANMVRTAIEQICMDTIQHAERSIGTRGLLPPQPMERVIRDLTIYLRQPAYDGTLRSVGKYALSSDRMADELWS
ncbi:acyl-CoA dehydrogenase family protein [Merismopedia glauca]|uniref:Acyl-CoA dehydrogenase n=1 Tax=Merismopedia glauca CCAP 1448/3 TaxID=1296344 RepID=A0A2T1C4T9_9CYAN|nr:acyl-CoA dehydrogenase family protein [Merismopedia glauca]PSB03276.1 acyl-CoA dehydrogenase [Merismopedia glauca CCAP 1448/3]